MEIRNQSVFGEEPKSPFIWRVRCRLQAEEPALGARVEVLMMEQWSGSFNELFMQQVLTSGNQKGRNWRVPSVDYSWQLSVIRTKIINV